MSAVSACGSLDHSTKHCAVSFTAAMPWTGGGAGPSAGSSAVTTARKIGSRSRKKRSAAVTMGLTVTPSGAWKSAQCECSTYATSGSEAVSSSSCSKLVTQDLWL
eukprot:COSAG01_NODE_8489_length_2768_cov_1.228550_2_plen_105_part_00